MRWSYNVLCIASSSCHTSCWKILKNCKSLNIPHNHKQTFIHVGGTRGSRDGIIEVDGAPCLGGLIWLDFCALVIHFMKSQNRFWPLKIEASPKCSCQSVCALFFTFFFWHVRVEEISSFRVSLQCMTLSCQPHWLWPIGTDGWVMGTAGGGTRWDWSHQEVFQFLKGYLATSHHSIDLRRGPDGSWIGRDGDPISTTRPHGKSCFPNWHMGLYRNNSSLWSKAYWVSPFLKYLWRSGSYVNIHVL